MTSARSQLPTLAQATPLIEAGLMKLRALRVRSWTCMVKVDGHVCRDRHNGTRSVAKDSRSMADHIYRHHAVAARDAGCTLGERGRMADDERV